jgi:hypothetical protein
MVEDERTYRRERQFRLVGVLIGLAVAGEVAQVLALQPMTAANLLTSTGALLILGGWWRFVMSAPEDRRDLHVLWAWAKFGLVLLAIGFVAGIFGL